MKQKIFTKDYSEMLKSSVEENMGYYRDPEFSWEAAAGNNVKELDFDQPDLSGMMQYAETNDSKVDLFAAQGGLSVAGGCRCLTKELDMIAC